MLPAQELAFGRTPIALIPENTTNATAPVATVAPQATSAPIVPNATSAPVVNATLPPVKLPDLLPCPECDKSLFSDAPTQPGERTKQKAFLVPFEKRNFRIVITEVQKTVRVRGGGLKTTTRRTRSTTELSDANNNLWGDLRGQDLAKAFERAHIARDAGVEGVRQLADETVSEEKQKREWKAGLEARKLELAQLKVKNEAEKAQGCPCLSRRQRPCTCPESPEVAAQRKAAVEQQLAQQTANRVRRAHK